MTNKQKWDSVTEALESPQIFIDLSWYFTISAALQRRVWFGNYNRAMFSNMYVLFVAPPATGKGTAAREGAKLLNKYALPGPDGKPLIDPETKEPRMLFTVLPDAVTFEKLVHLIAHCTQTVNATPEIVYAHASAYFALEELSSLFRRQKAEDVCRFLLNMYDCVPFKYDTKNAKTSTIKNGCLSLIACTQLDFMRKAENDGLLGEGLFSRMLIAYAERTRQVRFHYADLTAEQLQHQKDLQLWTKELHKLYGQVQYDSSVHDWLEAWWKDEREYLAQYQDGKLAEYFSRRKDQVIKLAIAHHFSENLNLHIDLKSFEFSAGLTRDLEPGVVKIARRTGRNAAFPIHERLIAYCKKPRSNMEVMDFLSSELDLTESLNTLVQLQQTGRIAQQGDIWQATTQT